MQTEKTDVLVIGAGPSGTVAASIVHQAGYKVKIVEKILIFVCTQSLVKYLPVCLLHQYK